MLNKIKKCMCACVHAWVRVHPSMYVMLEVLDALYLGCQTFGGLSMNH